MSAVIRRADSIDAASISKIHVETWRSAYRNLLPASVLTDQSVEHRLSFWSTELRAGNSSTNRTWVAEDAGEVIGFVSVGPCRDSDRANPTDWELFAIYLLEAHWGRGIGRDLAVQALRSIPPIASSVSLWVLSGNERAINFYQQLGFNRDNSQREEIFGGKVVTELRLVRVLPY